MVIKGLCAGLGDENGFALGDLGEGRVRGGGIVRDAEFCPLLNDDDGKLPKGLLLVLLAIAAAKGFVFAYPEKPPKRQGNVSL
jgi:hypothetical protein